MRKKGIEMKKENLSDINNLLKKSEDFQKAINEYADKLDVSGIEVDVFKRMVELVSQVYSTINIYKQYEESGDTSLISSMYVLNNKKLFENIKDEGRRQEAIEFFASHQIGGNQDSISLLYSDREDECNEGWDFKSIKKNSFEFLDMKFVLQSKYITNLRKMEIIVDVVSDDQLITQFVEENFEYCKEPSFDNTKEQGLKIYLLFKTNHFSEIRGILDSLYPEWGERHDSRKYNYEMVESDYVIDIATLLLASNDLYGKKLYGKKFGFLERAQCTFQYGYRDDMIKILTRSEILDKLLKIFKEGILPNVSSMKNIYNFLSFYDKTIGVEGNEEDCKYFISLVLGNYGEKNKYELKKPISLKFLIDLLLKLDVNAVNVICELFENNYVLAPTKEEIDYLKEIVKTSNKKDRFYTILMKYNMTQELIDAQKNFPRNKKWKVEEKGTDVERIMAFLYDKKLKNAIQFYRLDENKIRTLFHKNSIVRKYILNNFKDEYAPIYSVIYDKSGVYDSKYRKDASPEEILNDDNLTITGKCKFILSSTKFDRSIFYQINDGFIEKLKKISHYNRIAFIFLINTLYSQGREKELHDIILDFAMNFKGNMRDNDMISNYKYSDNFFDDTMNDQTKWIIISYVNKDEIKKAGGYVSAFFSRHADDRYWTFKYHTSDFIKACFSDEKYRQLLFKMLNGGVPNTHSYSYLSVSDLFRYVKDDEELMELFFKIPGINDLLYSRDMLKKYAVDLDKFGYLDNIPEDKKNNLDVLGACDADAADLVRKVLSNVCSNIIPNELFDWWFNYSSSLWGSTREAKQKEYFPLLINEPVIAIRIWFLAINYFDGRYSDAYKFYDKYSNSALFFDVSEPAILKKKNFQDIKSKINIIFSSKLNQINNLEDLEKYDEEQVRKLLLDISNIDVRKREARSPNSSKDLKDIFRYRSITSISPSGNVNMIDGMYGDRRPGHPKMLGTTYNGSFDTVNDGTIYGCEQSDIVVVTEGSDSCIYLPTDIRVVQMNNLINMIQAASPERYYYIGTFDANEKNFDQFELNGDSKFDRASTITILKSKSSNFKDEVINRKVVAINCLGEITERDLTGSSDSYFKAIQDYICILHDEKHLVNTNISALEATKLNEVILTVDGNDCDIYVKSMLFNGQLDALISYLEQLPDDYLYRLNVQYYDESKDVSSYNSANTNEFDKQIKGYKTKAAIIKMVKNFGFQKYDLSYNLESDSVRTLGKNL